MPLFASGSADCAPCHAAIYESYRRTGMGRSFSAATPGEEVADFYHAASGTHYSMSVRAGRYYQRRWQIGFDGKETNTEEMAVDYIMGSGNHARTYLSRTARGTLIQLPLGWYAEKGGYWAMNPGYDTSHPPSHRPVVYECMFCHNAYPRVPSGSDVFGSEPLYVGALPEGIDCRRCHGPGSKHVQAARSGTAKIAEIRAGIVNPGRLGKDKQMEVCMQCHLETASTRLPGLVRRFERGPFSYMPGQPLGDFILSFDHAPGSGYEDKFEIAGGAYRLRQSQCFLKSKGELTCETCHNPHEIPRGAEAAAYYARVCRQCHATAVDRLTASGAHPSNPDCVGCHMPKRRTEDAVHVAITDHRIQRRAPDRDLLAELQEKHPAPQDEYRGEVVPYYPSPLPATPENRLYLGLAQVRDDRNPQAGIAQLAAALRTLPLPDFFMELGDAWHAAGDSGKAAEAYGQALRLRPGSAREWRYLGVALHDSGQQARAEDALRRALRLTPSDARSWLELGSVLSSTGRKAEAVAALEKAAALDSDLPDLWNALGTLQNSEEAFRRAIRIDPFHAEANGNLARLLAARGDREQAVFYFDATAKLRPSDAVNLYEYALTLVQMNRFEDSLRQTRAAALADPGLAEAHELLGGLLARNRDFDAALAEFRRAVELKPEFSRAQLDLAATLVMRGDVDDAVPHFREAAKSADPAIANAAAQALRRVGK